VSVVPLRVPSEPVTQRADPSASAGGPPPEALVRAATEGDGRAFAALVARYHPRALRFARNLGLGREDAEEAVQDAFVRVHRALPRFTEGARFEPWFFRILSNQCRTTASRGGWWRRQTTDDAPLATLAVDSAGMTAMDAEVVRERVASALATLPAEQREAFLLRHVEQMEYEDMMRVTGAGASALRMRVKRACDALRARLTGEDLDA